MKKLALLFVLVFPVSAFATWCPCGRIGLHCKRCSWGLVGCQLLPNNLLAFQPTNQQPISRSSVAWMALGTVSSKPQPPKHLIGLDDGHDVMLTWTASTTLDVTYNVYRAFYHRGCPPASSPAWSQLVNGISDLTYTDLTVQDFKGYCYYVTADLNGVESVPSNIVTVKVT